ncbi:MAG: hypothetical protein JNK23_16215 [Opitutaceae bacterium]|nr:hypothetical protein [Opitutaceae bacterium]
MDSTRPVQRKPPVLIWWIIWAALLTGVAVLHSVLPTGKILHEGGAFRYLPAIPLLLSSLIRWLVLPKFTESLRAFPVFIIGLALAEGCVILGVFLVPDLRNTYAILGVLGLIQYMPLFAAKLR